MSNRNVCCIQSTKATRQTQGQTCEPEQLSNRTIGANLTTPQARTNLTRRHQPATSTQTRPQTLLQQATPTNRFNQAKRTKHTHNNAQFGSLTQKIEPVCQSS